MKIAEIRIKNYRQFKDIRLDFTDPQGKPVDKICFIGRNGTGKSTLLNLLNQSLLNRFVLGETANNSFISIKFQAGNHYFFLFATAKYGVYYFKQEITQEINWFEKITSANDVQSEIIAHSKFFLTQLRGTASNIRLKNNSADLLIYSPPESSSNSYLLLDDVPKTNLNDALSLFEKFPFYHTVSDQNVNEFWKMLIYLLKKRENERILFENNPQNIDKTKRQLIGEFSKKNPPILAKIAKLWNKILAHAGLEFDAQSANNPVQLTDNLKAYIRIKSTGERINYNQLSTGIRNFIFRIGHIYSLYFNREVKNGFLLLDEPENSLFPDFLFDLMETYQEIIVDKNGENNTQFFVSTHNPIIAAQFEPYERIVLEWNKDGFVDAFKGESPVGDDPNDLLIRDFKLKNLMGKAGQKMWNKYIELRKRLIRSNNNSEKKELMAQINKIGQLYNFED